LRLFAGPLRRDHEMAGDAIGFAGARDLREQMQAAIEARRDPGGCQDLAFIDKQRAGIDADFRVTRCKHRRARPMRGRAAPIEQSCLGQAERTKAQADNDGAPFTGRLQFGDDVCGKRLIGTAPSRQDDDIGLAARFERMADLDGQSADGSQGFVGADIDLVIARDEWLAEHRKRGREHERADLVIGEDGDAHWPNLHE